MDDAPHPTASVALFEEWLTYFVLPEHAANQIEAVRANIKTIEQLRTITEEQFDKLFAMAIARPHP